MKVQLFKNLILGLSAFALVFSSVSLANASDERKPVAAMIKAKESIKPKEDFKHKLDEIKKKLEGKLDDLKSKAPSKKPFEIKKKEKQVKSTIGKLLEKKLLSIVSSVNKTTKLIDKYFNSDKDETDKVLSINSTSPSYESFYEKLKADLNKLIALEKSLKKSKAPSSDLNLLKSKIEEVKKLIKSEETRVKTLVKKEEEQQDATESTTPEGDTSDESTKSEEPSTTPGESTDSATDLSTNKR